VRLLDLVAVATVADVVDLRGVNRILVAHGLKVMAKSPRAGIRAILEAAKVAKPTSMHCGFVLGPRINAAGRLQSARAAFDLLTSSDLSSAQELAKELERLNLERRATQDDILNKAREQARAQIAAFSKEGNPRWTELAGQIPGAQFGPWPRALVLTAPEGEASWHEGVVGIVASKIVEEFGRPAFVLASKEGADGVLKGSARSISKIDILAAISADSVARNLLNFGGHAHAGGVTLERSKLLDFVEALNAHLALTSTEEHFRRERRFDVEVSLDEIDAKLLDELQRLEPFGHQFPEPVFKVIDASALSVKVLKEKHLKLRLTGRSRQGCDAIWFNAVRDDGALVDLEKLEGGNACALWVSPQWNEWQGTKKLQLQIRHGELLSG
jgi:single-stranded-DNA-specific exonuclease